MSEGEVLRIPFELFSLFNFHSNACCFFMAAYLLVYTVIICLYLLLVGT